MPRNASNAPLFHPTLVSPAAKPNLQPISGLFLGPSRGAPHHRNFPRVPPDPPTRSHCVSPPVVSALQLPLLQALTLWLRLILHHHHTTRFPLPLPPLLRHSLCHSFIAVDDFHSLSLTNSSHKGTLVKADPFHPFPNLRSSRTAYSSKPRSTTGILRFNTRAVENLETQDPQPSSKKKRHRPILVKGSLDPSTFVQRNTVQYLCVEETTPLSPFHLNDPRIPNQTPSDPRASLSSTLEATATTCQSIYTP